MDFKTIYKSNASADLILSAAEIKGVGCVVITSSPNNQSTCFVSGVKLSPPSPKNKYWELIQGS